MLKLFVSHDEEIPLKVWKFPAGEVGVKIMELAGIEEGREFYIHLIWEGNDDLVALCQLVDAIRSQCWHRAPFIQLFVPYFPYSRQDRRCADGEAHALKIVAGIINSLEFDEAYTLDAHSYVLEAVVDNLQIVPQEDCAYFLPKFDVLIAPDQGASKKIYSHSQVKNGTQVIVASKVRDSEGRITKTELPYGTDLKGKSVCVVDDICDGGATFIELAKALEQVGCQFPNLYITHGIFSKGIDTLLGCYDKIYVYNLMNKTVSHPNLIRI